jgi:hypothetical protein
MCTVQEVEENEVHRGQWLVEHLRGLGEIELPYRKDDRPIPFADEQDVSDQA